ncbi:MAG: YebC/PmpR family DNA-binding transcriptional regulator [Alphaproteobacteria bacterium]|nr:YebC/PmpR family DNA-binding transcriptional regulator [Alphaproteobacteria bacterium]MCB9695474.1 YebC/PmpR family DNA-binding transcriptional regulator [Alphaproteobacteria bacterium]
MGRIFETRKATMFARWDRMAKAFARCNKEIVIAIRAGGPDPKANPALRRALQNARAVNMPKDKVEAAIKRAMGDTDEVYEELLYEAYAPHGIALMIETATDNPTRTVANLRSYFNKLGGNLGASGSVSYMFQRMGVFRLNPEGLDRDELELELIDHGLQEMGDAEAEDGTPQLVIRCEFTDFGNLQSAIEERGINVISAESEYVPANLIELSDEQAQEALAVIDKIEQDDDVQKVFHNLA